MYNQRIPLWVVGVVLAIVTMVRSTCDAAVYSDDHVWRPCRAASRRRYEEIVPTAVAGDAEDGNFGTEDDGGGGDDEELIDDDDYVQSWRPPPLQSFSMDDKLKRGIRVAPPAQNKLLEKKFDRPQHPVPSAPGNGLRMDMSLLRGETVELPTYVNVPVTLRCKFVPLDGTQNKFETIVEAMYPGHADSSPLPPDSHASQILKQLMGSVDGWRGIVNKSTRPVRRVIENQLGRWATWPPINYADRPLTPPATRFRYNVRREGGGRPHGTDVYGQQIATQLRAAERTQWFHEGGGVRQLDHHPWHSEKRVGGHQDEERLAKNQLIDEQPPTEQIDDQQPAEQIDDQQPAEQIDDQQPTEQIYDQPTDRHDNRQAGERVQQFHDARQDFDGWHPEHGPEINEQVIRDQMDDRPAATRIRATEHLQQFQSAHQDLHGWHPEHRPKNVVQEQVNNGQDELQQTKSGRKVIDQSFKPFAVYQSNGRAAEDGNDHQDVQDGSQAEELDPLMPEITTTAKWDYATFGRGIPIRTFMEQGSTTPSD